MISIEEIRDVNVIAEYYALKYKEATGQEKDFLYRTPFWTTWNWTYFDELDTVCKSFKWDSIDFIDAQFYRAKEKGYSKNVLPPSKICSPVSIAYYYDWLDKHR